MFRFKIDPFTDTNGIKMLGDQLERRIREAVRKEVTERLVAQFKVDIEEEVTSLVSRFTLDGIDKMRDVLNWEEELRVFLAYKSEDGTYKMPPEYYSEKRGGAK